MPCSDAEWWRIETLPELGGQLVPRTLVWAIAEQVLGANPALHMYTAGRAVRWDRLPQRHARSRRRSPNA